MISQVRCIHEKISPAKIEESDNGSTWHVTYENLCEICTAYTKGWQDAVKWYQEQQEHPK